MMTKVERYSISLGEAFDLMSNFAIYCDWIEQQGWGNKQIIEVTPGEEVTFINFKTTVPENAAKLVKFDKENMILAFFLDSDNKLIEDNKGYIIRPIENWIEVEEYKLI